MIHVRTYVLHVVKLALRKWNPLDCDPERFSFRSGLTTHPPPPPSHIDDPELDLICVIGWCGCVYSKWITVVPATHERTYSESLWNEHCEE